MKALVIGAGLIGLTTAYYLRRAGCDVEVVDGGTTSCSEASFANGGLLTSSMASPWSTPGCWRMLFASIGRDDLPLQLRWRALPHLTGWGLRFLTNSRRAVFNRNTQSNYQLAAFSLAELDGLVEATAVEFEHHRSGSLRIFRDMDSLQRAGAEARPLRDAGMRMDVIDAAAACEVEPALLALERQLAGAIFYPDDRTGDALSFGVAMERWLRANDVAFRFDTTVTSLSHEGDVVRAAITSKSEHLDADHFILATGSFSASLAKMAGLGGAVRPVKGYSLTLDRPGAFPLRVPIVDDHLHAVATPLGNIVRVAGAAEFAGFDRSLGVNRIRNLANLLQHIFPGIEFDLDGATPWCGFRPMTASGVPIIGRTKLRNVWANFGHGHLGWTMAAGSARLLSDMICGRLLALDPRPYAPVDIAEARIIGQWA